ncbi:MAG TPA: GNAT family N-acetyltransferase [Cyclobacteriaceae bacterium]|nr:GNAT family N-acetyltransferase [Cyclobacteriaceae bacterium]HNE06182.1 GNAT family N-acetyltransferase [Anaerolineales bacterium]
MKNKKKDDVNIRLWSDNDFLLLERLMGDSAMTEHLGGPETAEKIRERHERYCQSSVSGNDPMFVIILEPEGIASGSIGYWKREWQGKTIWETGWSILPEFQGYGIATKATALIVERARMESKHRFLHAFPSIDNAPSNAICRKAGFVLCEEVNFEYPPGSILRCNDWCLDLFAHDSTVLPA